MDRYIGALKNGLVVIDYGLLVAIEGTKFVSSILIIGRTKSGVVHDLLGPGAVLLFLQLVHLFRLALLIAMIVHWSSVINYTTLWENKCVHK